MPSFWFGRHFDASPDLLSTPQRALIVPLARGYADAPGSFSNPRLGPVALERQNISGGVQNPIRDRSPPIARTAIMLEQLLLEWPVDELRGIVIRRFFDMLAGHLQCDGSLGPADTRRPLRSDQNMLAGPPVFGIDDEIADGPVWRANQKILDVTDIAVAGVDIITGDVLDGMEARIAGLAERLHRPWLDNRRDDRGLAEGGACSH